MLANMTDDEKRAVKGLGREGIGRFIEWIERSGEEMDVRGLVEADANGAYPPVIAGSRATLREMGKILKRLAEGA
jgi:acylphosphatase